MIYRLLLTFHIVFCWHFTYQYLVVDFGKASLLLIPIWYVYVVARSLGVIESG